MQGVAQSELEVAPHKGPEVVPQPDEAKYFLGSSQPSEVAWGQHHRLINTTSDKQRNRALWALVVIGIVCLAAALGAGLGVGRANKQVSISSSAAYSSTVKTIGLSNTTQVRTIQASAITTTVPSSFPTTTPSSPECPTADKTNYTATNLPDVSFTYQILCNTNFEGEGGVKASVDLQFVNNVASFKDCLDASALYIFQTPAFTLPSLGLAGLLWDPTVPACWLKSNITLSEGGYQDLLCAAVLISK